MLGIAVQLIISWLLVWLFEKGNLSVLGFRPTPPRLLQFAAYFLITTLCCASGFLLRIYAGGELWELNPKITLQLIGEGVLWNLQSVLFEELIFRGVLLYILIKKAGTCKAIVFSAIGFGIYHWFSLGVFGNALPMIIIFIVTGLMGLLLAYAYAKTFSLYIPVAIHLGWNLTQIFIFSQGPIGNGIIIQTHPGPFRTDSTLLFLLVTIFPALSTLVINFLILKRNRKMVIAK